MTQPKCDDSRPLIYLAYEGPAVPVPRDTIRRAEDVARESLREYFRVWLTPDCFVRLVEKVVSGQVVWRDRYRYDLAGHPARPWGVTGVREESGRTRELEFDADGRIVGS